VSVLVLTKELLLFGLVVHFEVVFGVVALLSQFAQPPHELRQRVEQSFNGVLVADQPVAQDMAKPYHNSGQLIIAPKLISQGN